VRMRIFNLMDTRSNAARIAAAFRQVLLFASVLAAIEVCAKGKGPSVIDEIVIPAADGSFMKVDSSHERWQSLRTAVSEGPIHCLPQAFFSMREAVSADPETLISFGTAGIGQNDFELRERFSSKSFASHLALMDSALTRVFRGSSSRGSSGEWKEITRSLTKTNLSFCAIRSAKSFGGNADGLLRCELYFCVKGRAVCAFYEKSVKSIKTAVECESSRQMAMLLTWASEILKQNGGVPYVSKGTSEQVLNHVMGSLTPKCSGRATSTSEHSHTVNGRSGNSGIAFFSVAVILAFAVFFVRDFVFRRHNAFGNTVDVDRCLRTNRGLRDVVTQKMLEEWAIIIRYFSCGSEVHALCVPAVLFLWEKIFAPRMSQAEIMELNERIKRASGFDKVFSKRSFELESASLIKEHGYESAWHAWLSLCEFKYSISDRIAGESKLEMPSDFGQSVHRLLKNWDGKFDCVTAMLPIDWKVFFKEHPELSDTKLLVRYGVLPAGEQNGCGERLSKGALSTGSQDEDGELAFLNAGKDGIVRGMLWKSQQKVVLDDVSCRLYLPRGWNAEPEMETISPHDHVARMAGPREHEWLSVEHLHLSPGHVNDDLGDWINVARTLFGRLNLQPHCSKSSGVDAHAEIAFGRLDQRDALFMKYHRADDMAAFVGTIEIEGRMYRLFAVIVRRGADSWKFEYVFPAADGVTKESLDFRSEEIEAATRLFVPIETFGKMTCSVCGEKMNDPAGESDEEKIEVWMKGYFLFDDMQVPKAGVSIPCCAACREKILALGISKSKLEDIPAIHDQIVKGASILEVKCGTETVVLLESPESGHVPQTEDVRRDVEQVNDRNADLKEMQRRSQQLYEQIRVAEERAIRKFS